MWNLQSRWLHNYISIKAKRGQKHSQLTCKSLRRTHHSTTVTIGIEKKVGDIVILKDITPVRVESNCWFLLRSYWWHSDDKVTENKTVFSFWSQPQHEMVKSQLILNESQWRVRPLLITSSVKHHYEQCSLPFCFKPRDTDGPTLMEFLFSRAIMQLLRENERWRATGMLQNGSTQLNVDSHFFRVSLSSAAMERGRPLRGKTVIFPLCYFQSVSLSLLADGGSIVWVVTPPWIWQARPCQGCRPQ